MERNIIQFHYDGPISVDHRITLRTLGHTLFHIQSAVDRAAIDIKYGRVVKHARLKSQDYPLTDFIVGDPRDGGYILNLINSGPLKIVDRMNLAVSRAFAKASEDALTFTESLIKQAERRAFAIEHEAQSPISMEIHQVAVQQVAGSDVYADRAINREIDQVLSQIRTDRYAGSIFELQFSGDVTSPVYKFDREKAERFHHVVAARVLGDPVALTVKFRALDAGSNQKNPVGKAIHAESGKIFSIHFRCPEDFNSVVPYMRAGERPEVSIIACPVLEYGVFDEVAGDMFFMGFYGE
jgi:hypothetical protein